jgi:uncharacterized protein (DUF58 family)
MRHTLYHRTFLTNRFFVALGIAAALFACGFLARPLFTIAQVYLLILALLVLVDMVPLSQINNKLDCQRDLPPVLSLGDEVMMTYILLNQQSIDLQATIIDEWPVEYQRRNLPLTCRLPSHEKWRIQVPIVPVKRGVYKFGKTNLVVKSPLGLVEMRQTFDTEHSFKVYPSTIQMKQHELAVIRHAFQFQGQKKLRRLGHSYEFEQIRNYISGDDYRSVNWKATGRKGELMVNQYGDEQSQQIYSVIDTSRVMQMPFKGMTLMDYAINTSLVLSNIALLKHDRAGLISFAEKMGHYVRAGSRSNQLRLIMDALYNERNSSLEADYHLLYSACQKIVRRRSLFVLYTNFESKHALLRVVPILRRINRQHLLLVVFFENDEITNFSKKECGDLIDVYESTMASKFHLDKKLMIKTLQQYGIQAILTTPDDLSIHTVNKYLELKSKGAI